MSPWAWWAGHPGEETYDIAFECESRDAVIADARRELGPGDTFRIVEARSSTAMKYEGADVVPFLRTRNHEVITIDATAPPGAP